MQWRCEGLPDDAKRQVDARPVGLARFGDLMLPVMLGRSAHQKQTAVRKHNFPPKIEVGLVLKLELTGRTETDRRDDGIDSQFRLVVTMPGDAIALATVLVEKNTVEADARDGFYLPTDGYEFRCPVGGRECQA